MLEYKDHYVAFLDILGFKDRLKDYSCEEIRSIFEVLKTRTTISLNLNDIQIMAFDPIEYLILSDSIVIHIDAQVDDAFASLLYVCRSLQVSLANRERPILLRGGITKGSLYREKEIVFGEGLARAYLLESKLAQFPRIIFSGETLSEGKGNTKYMFPLTDGIATAYLQDDDRLYYIDYLTTTILGLDDRIRYYDSLFALCDKFINKEVDHSLRIKYLWLLTKLEKAIERFPQIREYYEKEREKEREVAFEKYREGYAVYSEQSI